ncbi:MAG: hypothetical protein WC718_01390 [Phycisphaerales bacterium]|jgi:hypothetical protein
MALGLSLSLSTPRGGSAAPTYSAPFQDNFVGAAADINGRTVDGKTWGASNYTGGALTIYKTDGSGYVTGSGTSGQKTASFVHYTQAPAGNDEWVSRRYAGATLNFAGVHDHLTTGALSTDTHRIQILWSGGGNDGAITLTPVISGVAQSTTAANIADDVLMLAGDVVQTRYRLSGGNIVVDTYHNGYLCQTGLNLTGYSFPAFTHKHALGGVGTFPASSIDDMQVGDPLTHGMLCLNHPNRIAQKNANGDVVLRFAGEYTLTAPASLKYTLYNSATKAAVTGHTDQTVASLVTGSGLFTGQSQTIASADVPATFEVYVYRGDMASGSTLGGSWSPIIKAGHVLITNGQSVNVRRFKTTATATAAQPTDVWISDGSIEIVSTSLLSRFNRAPVNTSMAQMGQRWRTKVAGSVPLTMIRGGQGATKIAERQPLAAGGYYERLVEGLKRAGDNALWYLEKSGEYDVASADRATYNGYLNTIIDALEARIGHTLTVMLSPVGSYQSAVAGTITDWEAMRFQQWLLIQNSPTRYKQGSWTHDIQHASGDAYHHSVAGDEEQGVRDIDAWAYHLGEQSFGRFGPSIASIVRNSSTQVTVTFNLNGAASMQMRNAGATLGLGGTADYRGGLRFAAASTFATPLNPTSIVDNGISGSTWSFTFNFAANSFPTTAYVSGPYGANPFNPENNTTINNALAANAVILEGLYTGDNAVAVQPYYQTSGVNYLSAS